MTVASPTIAFIGLGTMGLPMAANIVQKWPNAHLYAFDIVTDALQQLKENEPRRITICDSAKEAAEQAVSPRFRTNIETMVKC